MFSKISRYRNEPDDVTVDARGRTLESKGLRLLPEVTGAFLHIIEAGDRLDHLAYKYYNQSRNWWRIIDANPAFLSPQALVGGEPRTTLHFDVTWSGPSPPWTDLLQALRQGPGVETALLGDGEQPMSEAEVVQGPPAFDLAPALVAALVASARAQQLTPPLEAALLAEGISFAAEVRLEQPDAVTWYLYDLQTLAVFTIQHFPDEALLRIYTSAIRYAWVVEVAVNTTTTSEAEARTLIEGQGFTVAASTEIGRVGKAIVIPPRAT